jgi:hypothetical protein
MAPEPGLQLDALAVGLLAFGGGDADIEPMLMQAGVHPSFIVSSFIKPSHLRGFQN